MAARFLALLLLAAPTAALSADCAGADCPAEGDDSVSLLAHRASGSSSSRRRGGGCPQETGSMTTLPVPDLSDFSAVAAEGDIQVSLVVGSASGVVVKVDSGLANFVDVSVTEGTLYIKFFPPCEDVDDDPTVTVTSPSLPTAISATKDAQVTFPTWPFKTNSDIEASVETMTLTATLDAQIQLKKVNVTGSLTITADNDAQVDTQWTVSQNAVVSAKDDSQVQGGITHTLVVDITDDSDVKYYVTGSATGSVTDDSELKVKAQGAAASDTSGVTVDSSSQLKID